MNANMIRMGGIAAIVALLLMIVTALLGQTLQTNRGLAIILGLITTGLIIFTFWSTKALFNSRNYHRADVTIMVIIGLWALIWLFSLFGGGGLTGVTSMQTAGESLGVIGIISLLVTLAAFVIWFLFAFQAIGFANHGGGGLWKAIGVLYVIGIVLMIIMVLLLILGAIVGSLGLMAGAGVLGLIGGLVVLAAWICHAIGLLMGASLVPRTA
jgi:hypothetical protein